MVTIVPTYLATNLLLSPFCPFLQTKNKNLVEYDNNKFWERVKPLFGNKIKGNPNIRLAEGNNLIRYEKSLVENLVSNLGVYA